MPEQIALAPYISVVAVARHGAQDGAHHGAHDGAHDAGFTEAWNAGAAACGLSSEVLVTAPECRNAALRQARGEFVLCTEADARFSPELFQFLAARKLESHRLYRLDCHQGDWLHAREGSFRLTAEGLRANWPRDIAADDAGIHFGEGWFPPEGEPEVYRWMEDRAEILPAHGGALELDVEPGPGAGALPLAIQVLDAGGARVAEFALAKRTVLRLWVPAEVRGLRIVVPDGGRALLDDLRILNLRCFRCAWVEPVGVAAGPRELDSMRPTLLRLLAGGGWLKLAETVRLLRGVGADIFGPGIEYWGSGWHRLEESGSEKFHWVDRDAELVVRTGAGARDLCLLVEPGPSLHGQPFQLVVRLEDGAEIARAQVKGLTPLRLPLPLAPGAVAKLRLSPDRQGAALPGDSRVLHFRVLACTCEASKRPAAPLRSDAAWPAVTVSEAPAAIDWAQCAEIGKPAFLHVNACDFVLMARARWLDLRGYAETGEPREIVDALLCYAAHFAGAAEEILRAPICMTRPWEERASVPLDDDMVWLITQMRRLRAPVILNGEGWGHVS